MRMVMFMKDNGLKINNMARVPIFILMEVFIMGNGKMTNRMDMESRNGPMAVVMKENIQMEFNTAKEYSAGEMELHTVASFRKE